MRRALRPRRRPGHRPRRPPSAAEQPPDLATAKVVDLTHPFDEKTIYWPTSPSAFELKSLADGKTPGGWFYRSNTFCTPEHGGTHLDAPSHFAKDGAGGRPDPASGGSSRRPPSSTSGRQAAKDPDYRLTARRRESLGEGARRHPRRSDRPPADGLERAVAGPEGLPRRRHAGRRLEAALSRPTARRPPGISWRSARSERSASTRPRSTTARRRTSSFT